MTPLQPLTIIGYEGGGLVNAKKPFLIAEEAFSRLENAYIWRNRAKKREGMQFVGRLRRTITARVLPTIVAGATTLHLFAELINKTGAITGITKANPGEVTAVAHGLVTGMHVTLSAVGGMNKVNGETYIITTTGVNTFTIGVDTTPASYVAYGGGGVWTVPPENPEIDPGTLVLSLLGVNYYDKIIGTHTAIDGQIVDVTGGIVIGNVNYVTGDVYFAAANPGDPATANATLTYYPGLPAMGIWQREIPAVNFEETFIFDEKYAYRYASTGFMEVASTTATEWNSSDSDFFYCCNYHGITPDLRYLFTTNFICDQDNPMRYYDDNTWKDFAPAVATIPASEDPIILPSDPHPPAASVVSRIWSAKIIVPFYGRLLCLNTWEGVDINDTDSTSANYVRNYYNRCRACAVGDPIAGGDPWKTNAWRTDIYGQGFYMDAPTDEAITGAWFFKNLLIVGFERSTWQLLYVGEYGMPFRWERISSDFGTESTYSGVLFDQGILSIADKGIVSSSGLDVQRIDAAIPDQVFAFQNDNEGTKRIQAVRDFRKELVYWSYCDSATQNTTDVTCPTFPTKVLVFNYKNQTWAQFRDNVTCFGTFQSLVDTSVLWSSDTRWDSETVTWADTQFSAGFPAIICGNQQGFIHKYTTTLPDDKSLAVSAVDTSGVYPVLTVKNHNFLGDPDEYVYLSGGTFTDAAHVVTTHTVTEGVYLVRVITRDTIAVEPATHTVVAGDVYIGGMTLAMRPVMYIKTKDFNPYAQQGGQFKLSYIDLQVDRSAQSRLSILLYVNSSLSAWGNDYVGNREVETHEVLPYNVPAAQYLWHRFFASSTGQYLSVVMTYDDTLMRLDQTHVSNFELNAMTLWIRPGGKNVF